MSRATESAPDAQDSSSGVSKSSLLELLAVFTRLGVTSFGGPVAHLGYFREEFVKQRQWMSEKAYADLVALCQFLPGPASSQVGMAVGYARGGYLGALVAWLGFTMPSALALIGVAYGAGYATSGPLAGVITGLKIVAVAVVAEAVWGMGKKFVNGPLALGVMVVAAAVVLLVSHPLAQVGVIVAAGAFGVWRFSAPSVDADDAVAVRGTRAGGAVWLALFVGLLFVLPVAARVFEGHAVDLVDSFYRSGALVFGGGHVVLPLLQAEVVPPGWVTESDFLAGYGAAQAVPGPLFTFAAFLGASSTAEPSGWLGGLMALGAVFLPAALLVFGTLPFWERVRRNAAARSALVGINAAVVGVLLAALFDPVFVSAVEGPPHFVVALVAAVALMGWKLPPWVVVLGTAVAGAVIFGTGLA